MAASCDSDHSLKLVHNEMSGFRLSDPMVIQKVETADEIVAWNRREQCRRERRLKWAESDARGKSNVNKTSATNSERLFPKTDLLSSPGFEEAILRLPHNCRLRKPGELINLEEESRGNNALIRSLFDNDQLTSVRAPLSPEQQLLEIRLLGTDQEFLGLSGFSRINRDEPYHL